jgi:hypothetical protein
VWTGSSDHTIRRLTIALTLPVTGKASSELGGMTSADIALTMQYANLNQPQTITAPTSVHPFSEFQTKLQSFLQAVEGAAQGAIAGSSSGSTGTATSPSTGTGTATSPSSGSAKKVTNYSQCIAAANGDVSKMQKCASLLGGG